MEILRPKSLATPASAVPSASTTTRAAMSDWVGVLASVGCAIHCAAMPFVVSFLPMLGLSFLADESFHQVMMVVCLLIAVATFVPGRRRHRRWMPIAIASVGLTLIATAAFAFEGECCATCAPVAGRASIEDGELVATQTTAFYADACCEHCVVVEQAEPPTIAAVTLPATSSWLWLITPLGGMLLVTAHLTNRYFVCRCGSCPSDPTDSGATT